MLFLDCNGEFSLARLRTGETAELVRLEQGCGMRRRLLDLGGVPGTPVECVGHSPAGDPGAYLIRGVAIALRREDAHNVWVLREVE